MDPSRPTVYIPVKPPLPQVTISPKILGPFERPRPESVFSDREWKLDEEHLCDHTMHIDLLSDVPEMHHPGHGIREADDSRVDSQLRVVLHGHPRLRISTLRSFLDKNLLVADAAGHAGQDSNSKRRPDHLLQSLQCLSTDLLLWDPFHRYMDLSLDERYPL
ncbi:hypothetical protein ANCCAN_23896 [Ancylostoma caninum]|uniref:Uncharacterized protein n=1 Tax=Ancylostoma caninum TaxID=29170 RepID=A0A368FDR9_ANCCA|nr:hypothetical protein ANCCAN_23896 [Ancylostoma caninum]